MNVCKCICIVYDILHSLPVELSAIVENKCITTQKVVSDLRGHFALK